MPRSLMEFECVLRIGVIAAFCPSVSLWPSSAGFCCSHSTSSHPRSWQQFLCRYQSTQAASNPDWPSIWGGHGGIWQTNNIGLWISILQSKAGMFELLRQCCVFAEPDWRAEKHWRFSSQMTFLHPSERWLRTLCCHVSHMTWSSHISGTVPGNQDCMVTLI